MSHFLAIKTQIKDLTALRKAAEECGCVLAGNGTGVIVRGYNGRNIVSPIAIKTPPACPYDIAVTKEKDGTYSLSTDWWLGHVEKHVGKDYGKLMQLYGVNKATLAARAKGYMVARQPQKNGAIKLVVTGAF